MNVFMIAMGTGAYSVQLAAGLASRGINVSLQVASGEGEEIRDQGRDFLSQAGIKYHIYRKFSWWNPGRIAQFLTSVYRIWSHKTNVLHVTNTGLRNDTLIFALLMKFVKIPIVTTVHDAEYHPGDITSFARLKLHLRILELSGHFIVHGNQIKDQFNKRFLYPLSRISVIPHGNSDLYLHNAPRAGNRAPNCAVALFFGRMVKYKGLDVLLQAAEILLDQNTNVRIVIAGKGPELKRLRPRCMSLSNIEVRERYLSYSELAQLFTACSFLLVPYIEASQSGPMCTAFSFGKPVIASKVGAISETLRHREHGLLVPPGDPKSLAEAIIDLAKNPELCSQMGEAGRKRASTDLSWSGEIADKTIKVYENAQTLNAEVNDREYKKRLTAIRRYYQRYVHEFSMGIDGAPLSIAEVRKN